jgi:hypothetical protein
MGVLVMGVLDESENLLLTEGTDDHHDLLNLLGELLDVPVRS